MRINRVKLITEMARQEISCKHLAELSGISRVTITNIRGGKSCSKETAERLAAVLGRDIIKED